MAKTELDHAVEQELNLFFEAARDEKNSPSDDLMAAILKDAADHLPAADGFAKPLAIETRRRFWSDMLSALGGWPAFAGMVTASLTGVWIGFVAPAQLEELSGGLLLSGDYTQSEQSYALEDMAPSYLSASLFLEDEG